MTRTGSGNMAGKRLFPFFGLLVLLLLPVRAEQRRSSFIGLYTGWSFSLKDKFIDEAPDGHTINHNTPNFILGGYWQYSPAGPMDLQFSMNVQNCSQHWVFSYFDRHNEGSVSLQCVSFNLNSIVNVMRSTRMWIYALGGVGVFVGPFEYNTSFIQLSGGAGVKFRVKPGSRTFVDLAAIFHHLLPTRAGSHHAEYLRLQTGLAFLY